MTLISDKYRGSGEYFLVFNELVTAARYRGTITYEEIADLIGLLIAGAHMGVETGHLLGEISEDEHKRGRPMLSAIAVGVSGSPGPGFFACARKLGKLTDEEEHPFWIQERNLVHEFWRRKF